MFGAILGDMAGSVYERHSIKTKDFPIFSEHSRFTDDSIMSVAVADVCRDILGKAEGMSDEDIRKAFAVSMRKWGQKYPHAGYGRSFSHWLATPDAGAYNSWGNGSAMRVSAVGWMFKTLEETRRIARLSAEVTHNHSEGIKGAEATASAIYILRTGGSKADVKGYITRGFGYDLDRTVEGIRPGYKTDVSCQHTVPESIISFLDGESTEDAIRNAVSLGGDADTLGCIAGSIAEALWGVPAALKREVMKRLDEDMEEAVDKIECLNEGSNKALFYDVEDLHFVPVKKFSGTYGSYPKFSGKAHLDFLSLFFLVNNFWEVMPSEDNCDDWEQNLIVPLPLGFGNFSNIPFTGNENAPLFKCVFMDRLGHEDMDTKRVFGEHKADRKRYKDALRRIRGGDDILDFVKLYWEPSIFTMEISAGNYNEVLADYAKQCIMAGIGCDNEDFAEISIKMEVLDSADAKAAVEANNDKNTAAVDAVLAAFSRHTKKTFGPLEKMMKDWEEESNKMSKELDDKLSSLQATLDERLAKSKESAKGTDKDV